MAASAASAGATTARATHYDKFVYERGCCLTKKPTHARTEIWPRSPPKIGGVNRKRRAIAWKLAQLDVGASGPDIQHVRLTLEQAFVLLYTKSIAFGSWLPTATHAAALYVMHRPGEPSNDWVCLTLVRGTPDEWFGPDHSPVVDKNDTEKVCRDVCKQYMLWCLLGVETDAAVQKLLTMRHAIDVSVLGSARQG